MSPQEGTVSDWPQLAPDEIQRLLTTVGFVGPVFAGIQMDVNNMFRRESGQLVDAYVCDHNCTTAVDGELTGGSYRCPASTSLNRHLVPGSLASGDYILEGIRRVAQGLRTVRHTFFHEHFEPYADEFGMPLPIRRAVQNALDTDKIEVALFGGSPEIHPDILTMIRTLKAEAYPVHVTMTGRRLMRDTPFGQELIENPPDMLTLSLDDVESVSQLERLAALSRSALLAQWREIPRFYGQRQKVYEALYTIRLRTEYGADKFPNVLLNMALHHNNLRHIEALLDCLTQAAPGVIINAFPVQTGFDGVAGSYSPEDLDRLERFVDQMILQHQLLGSGLPARWQIAPRLHYWLLLKAVFEVYRGDPRKTANVLCGAGLWTCYRSPVAGRYVQVTSTGEAQNGRSVAGGYLSCFWNKSVTERRGAVWDLDSADIDTYLVEGRALAASSAKTPCAGCGFPRLLFDGVGAEMGMHPALRARYVQLRRVHLGF